MSGYNELDDILISLRQRREENEAGESATGSAAQSQIKGAKRRRGGGAPTP